MAWAPEIASAAAAAAPSGVAAQRWSFVTATDSASAVARAASPHGMMAAAAAISALPQTPSLCAQPRFEAQVGFPSRPLAPGLPRARPPRVCSSTGASHCRRHADFIRPTGGQIRTSSPVEALHALLPRGIVGRRPVTAAPPGGIVSHRPVAAQLAPFRATPRRRRRPFKLHVPAMRCLESKIRHRQPPTPKPDQALPLRLGGGGTTAPPLLYHP
eukprot:scaffold24553_cov65-Isochrysis_galbana.AAC.1